MQYIYTELTTAEGRRKKTIIPVKRIEAVLTDGNVITVLLESKVVTIDCYTESCFDDELEKIIEELEEA